MKLVAQLNLTSCPHCGVNKPTMTAQGQVLRSIPIVEGRARHWKAYFCARCGGAVIAGALADTADVYEMYPTPTVINEAIPDTAQNYLQQAMNSLHAPAGAVMLCASAVDAMLKEKNCKKGTLNKRIDKATDDRLITEDMKKWAHNIRLDANEPRHADEKNPLPNDMDAKRCLDFALALAEILFVLPSRVTRGLEELSKEKKEP